MRRGKRKSIRQASKGVLVFYIILLAFGARGLYYWSMSHEVGSIGQEGRYITQRLWSLSAKLGLEEPIFLVEQAFNEWVGIEPVRELKRYETIVAERAAIRKKLAESKESSPASVTAVETDNVIEVSESAEPPSIEAQQGEPSTEEALVQQETSEERKEEAKAQVEVEVEEQSEESEPKVQVVAESEVEQTKEAASPPESMVATPVNPVATVEDKPAKTPVKKATLAKVRPKPGKPKGTWLTIGSEQSRYRALLFGDSLMKGIGPTMAKSMRDDLAVHSVIHTKVSSGLARPKFFNWMEELPKNFQKDNYAFAVVFMGANDNQSMKVGSRVIKYGSKDWLKTYTGRLDKLMTLACGGVERVVWLGLPPMRKKRFEARTKRLNRIVQDVARDHSCIQFMPLDKVIGTSKGGYTTFLKVGRRFQKVRATDGIHLTKAGGKVVAVEVMKEVRRILGLSKASGGSPTAH